MTEPRGNRRNAYLALGIGVLALWVVGAILVMGAAVEFLVAAQAGLGWRDAAILSFLGSTGLIVLLAIAGGDGLLGELPTMLIGLVVLFLLLWIGLAVAF